MNFKDMNGNAIKVGNIIEPTEGQQLLIVSIGFHSELKEMVLYGQQLMDNSAFAILTASNLATQWKTIQ